ncbi:hypothetical protein WR25_07147 [Diploscapter pachys]|uniref:Uncharacterized protein n=1 Tax=Diploscapter pachys TaxID=2018661 RepID=A0A2A2M2D1_9BILA|nr:hypothetical protein WR25_07147 [Diploscapter pachys]
MLATAIRIYGAVEGQVRGGIAGDDGLRHLDPYLGALGYRHLLVPPVILGHRTTRGETVVRVAGGAAAADGRSRHDDNPFTVFLYSIMSRHR